MRRRDRRTAMFSKILIANRGEIACRVIRTARRMGIGAVAVYSEADAGALHVAMADEARLIGPPPARESYLDIAAVIGAARDSCAEAVHPGYGFLSENAEFAEACVEAGLVFIGPPAGAIRAMGSKAAAKALMEAHGVPVVPGYHGAEQEEGRLRAEAERIGFPVMIKASSGGGGRGMRIVADAGEFAAALDGARREAAGAFGDDKVLIERYLAASRHIEVQVFGDTHSNAVHLFERDCSIEARLYAENPATGFLPSTGTLHGLHLPAGEGVRVDSGVRAGDRVSPYYDAMIAKLIAWGEDRETARARLRRALGDTALVGVAANLGFLARVAADPDFAAGRVDTRFIQRRRATLLAPPEPVPELARAAAALYRLVAREEAVALAEADRFTPW